MTTNPTIPHQPAIQALWTTPQALVAAAGAVHVGVDVASGVSTTAAYILRWKAERDSLTPEGFVRSVNERFVAAVEHAANLAFCNDDTNDKPTATSPMTLAELAQLRADMQPLPTFPHFSAMLNDLCRPKRYVTSICSLP